MHTKVYTNRLKIAREVDINHWRTVMVISYSQSSVKLLKVTFNDIFTTELGRRNMLEINLKQLHKQSKL